MGFDALGVMPIRTALLRLDANRSDSLVNDQILREIEEQNRDASFTDSQNQSLDFFKYWTDDLVFFLKAGLLLMIEIL